MQNLVIPNFKIGPMHGLFILCNAAHTFQIFFFGAIKGTRAVIGLTQPIRAILSRQTRICCILTTNCTPTDTYTA